MGFASVVPHFSRAWGRNLSSRGVSRWPWLRGAYQQRTLQGLSLCLLLSSTYHYLLLPALPRATVLVVLHLSKAWSKRRSYCRSVWTWSRGDVGEGDESSCSANYEHAADADMGWQDLPKDREVGGQSGGAPQAHCAIVTQYITFSFLPMYHLFWTLPCLLRSCVCNCLVITAAMGEGYPPRQ